MSTPKTRDLSVFCSSQVLTPSHRMRLRFVEVLKEELGTGLDWFGNGVNPTPDKWTGIAPYRYTIVLENSSVYNLFTEKIMDAYLGLAFPIYWGAPNLGNYFPEESFVPINIRDLRGSLQQIREIVTSDLAETRQAALLEAKRRTLDDHNVFVRYARIAQALIAATPCAEPEQVTLWSLASEESKLTRRDPLATLGRKLVSAGHRLTR